MKRVFLVALMIAVIVFCARHCRAEVVNVARLDFDDLGSTLWWVGEIPVSDGFSWLTDCIVYVNQRRAEIDTGPTFSLLDGKFQVNPTLGVEIDWLEETREFDLPYLTPSLFLFILTDNWHGESWTQFFGPVSKGVGGFCYLRDFVYYRVVQRDGWALGVGPQVEATLLPGQDDFRCGGLVALEVGRVTFVLFGGTDRGGNPTGRATVICVF